MPVLDTSINQYHNPGITLPAAIDSLSQDICLFLGIWVRNTSWYTHLPFCQPSPVCSFLTGLDVRFRKTSRHGSVAVSTPTWHACRRSGFDPRIQACYILGVKTWLSTFRDCVSLCLSDETLEAVCPFYLGDKRDKKGDLKIF